MVHGDPLVHVTRGPLVESVHTGHVAVTDAHGNLLYDAGDPAQVMFVRSAAKPLQAVPLIERGGAETFGLSDREIAVICASHNGEAEHLAAVSEILRKIGCDASKLQCGVHAPLHRPAAKELIRKGEQPGPLHNNCSGKHAGMLALAVLLEAPTDGYDQPDHPVQQRAKETIYGLAGLDPAEAVTATDGCGVPVFAMPLAALARAYARFGAPDALAPAAANACRRIVRALQRAPFHLAGTGRFDSELIRVTGGRIIGKMGAEGVFAMTIPDRRIGIALKIADGSERALYPAAVEVLAQLDALSPVELEQLQPFRRPSVLNRRGEPVGAIKPQIQLRARR